MKHGKTYLGGWVVCGLAGWFCAAGMAVRGADHPQFGAYPSRNMVSAERNLPATFDPQTGKNIKWSVELGKSYASPIVAGGRVYIGCNNRLARDPRHRGDRGVLLCLDEKTGKLLWQLVTPKALGDKHNDWPYAGMCSAPAVEADRVYMVTNRSEVLCLDAGGLADGNDGPFTEEGEYMALTGEPAMTPGKLDADILWKFDLRQEVGQCPHDSIHSCILIVGDHLYLNTGNGVDPSHTKLENPEAPTLIVLDKHTGQLLAQDDAKIGRATFHCNYSSPSMGRINGERRIFFAGGNAFVYGFEPVAENVKPDPKRRLTEIWRFDCDPAAPKENLGKYLHNREVSPSVIYAMPVFDDGRVYVTVGGDYWWGKRQCRMVCIDAAGTGDITDTGQIWSYPLGRHVLGTPAVHDGLVYIADCGGLAHGVDAKTGKAHWTAELKGEVWSSPLVADGKVYFATRRGEVAVFATGRQKRELGRIQLRTPIAATPVAANGTLYIATQETLFAIGK